MRLVALAISLAAAHAQAAQSLCSKDEAVVFACAAGKSGKLISLCASGDLSSDRASLSYRFGRPGQVELQFPPQAAAHSARRFRYAHYYRSLVDRKEVSFRSGDFLYSVFSYYDEEENPSLMQGVRVTRGKQDTQQLCAGKAVDGLARLETAVPCDEGNALASCP